MPRSSGATTQPLVWIHGGPTVSIVNNVMSGGPFVPNCTYTCTTMTDYAVTVRSGDIDISDNRIENFRRPVNVNQSTPGTPITSATVSNNVITGVTSRGISIAPSTGQNAMPGISVTGNQVDAVGRTAPSSPAGITVSSHDNVISGNTFTGLSSGVYIDLCKKFSTQNNDVSTNTFSGNGTGLSIGVNQDGGACINGTAEGSGNWVVGGGKLDGLSVNGNTFSGNTRTRSATTRTGSCRGIRGRSSCRSTRPVRSTRRATSTATPRDPRTRPTRPGPARRSRSPGRPTPSWCSHHG